MKSIYEEAVETLNKYRNQNYNSTNKDEVELANAINIILPKYVKQEKLLKLYQKLYRDIDDLTLDEQLKIQNQIGDIEYKELENEKNIIGNINQTSE